MKTIEEIKKERIDEMQKRQEELEKSYEKARENLIGYLLGYPTGYVNDMIEVYYSNGGCFLAGDIANRFPDDFGQRILEQKTETHNWFGPKFKTTTEKMIFLRNQNENL